MKITKFVHSCLLVETDNRVALFDPGSMSYPAFDFNVLSKLDEIFITHIHQDHLDINFLKKVMNSFPEVKITGPKEVVTYLNNQSINADDKESAGVKFFISEHENVKPLFPQPEQIGIHYLDNLTVPGDSHSFKETKDILALPITAPWGSTIKALNLVLDLQPKEVIPIHDWHWSDVARQQMYDTFEKVLADRNIKFHKVETGRPVEINIDK